MGDNLTLEKLKIDDRLRMVEETTKRIEYSISGNGDPGLNERVRNIETFIVDLKNFNYTVKKVLIGCTGTVVSSIIIAMLVFFLIPR